MKRRASQTATEAAAYRKMLDEGSLDRCGVTLLAGKAVGAPFVGAVAATLVLAEVLTAPSWRATAQAP